MAHLSADYSNYEQLVFCDAEGVPGQYVTPCEFEGVASFRGQEIVDQFTEINPELIERAKAELAAEPEQPAAEEVVAEELPTETVAEEETASDEVVIEEPGPDDDEPEAGDEEPVAGDDPDECVAKLLVLGIPESLTDELALEGLCSKDAILQYHEKDGLESISGIGPASAKKILDALA